MRTTVVIPDKLIKEAQELTGLNTKTGVLISGLKELIHREKIRELQSLSGKIKLDINIDASRKRK